MYRRIGILAAIIATAVFGVVSSSSAQPQPTTAAVVQATFPLVGEAANGFRDSQSLTGTGKKTMGLDLPAGAYSITAKLTVLNNNSEDITVACRLELGTNFDDSFTTLTAVNERRVLALNVVGNLAASGGTALRCNTSSATANTTLLFVKVTATRLNQTYVSGLIG
ncbi:hypothetical protein F4553_007790 [Allocatelliglobosispora scoriae]|uniref:Uncharacterized protein n=1 Tax=Allocatelliglobosispora scoriae TaxID=643052 RepID=A0A841C367_9ACTN|nr:hypothetical protein [Allocatelliglobosispora scoriae]MBB5874356.1 hypothetical protein [Allocatelliglobosispora scoriae]